MKTKHTPGPWKVYRNPFAENDTQLEVAQEITNCSRMPVAYLAGYAGKEANALLIAAAPDMLEALKLVVARLRPFTAMPVGAPGSPSRIEQDDQIAAYNAVLAAIKKAEGAV